MADSLIRSRWLNPPLSFHGPLDPLNKPHKRQSWSTGVVQVINAQDKEKTMLNKTTKVHWLLLVAAVLIAGGGNLVLAQEPAETTSSYMPVDQTEPFAAVLARMKAGKAAIAKQHPGHGVEANGRRKI
jgi:hypothetical protein